MTKKTTAKKPTKTESAKKSEKVVKAENKESVAKYVDMVAKENGCNITLKKFVRFETGEGLEKKNEDFAAEVASQLGN